MSIFVIKIIACITMFLDHIKYSGPEFRNFITIYFGRISFPLFAFMISEGYIHTKNLKKYYIRLLIFALVSQIPFMIFRTLVGEWKLLNIMFTLILGLTCIVAFDKIKNKFLSIPLCGAIIWLGYFIHVDYGWYGVAMVLLFYVFKNKKRTLCIAYTLLVLIYLYISKVNVLKHLTYVLFHLIPLSIILLYNGKKGRDDKKLTYLFYPIHMLVVYLISLI